MLCPDVVLMGIEMRVDRPEKVLYTLAYVPLYALATGKRTENVLPFPGVLWTSIEP